MLKKYSVKIEKIGKVKIIYGLIICAIVLIMYLITLLVPGFDSESTIEMDYDSIPFQSPIKHPPFGTDNMGRDVFKLIIAGSGSFFIPSLIATGIALSLGIVFGSISSYYSKSFSWILSIATIAESMPRWVLIAVTCAVSKANIYWVMVVLGLTNFPKIASLINGRILQLKKEQFVEASRELGLNDFTIIEKHLLRKNCKHIIFGQLMHGIADAILVESTIRYLFYSVGAKVSWGKMAFDGIMFFFRKAPGTQIHPFWLWLCPALMIVLTISGFYILGDVLTKWYEAKDIESYTSI